MIEQQAVNDLATIFPLIAHATGAASALVNLTPYSLPVVKDSAGYETFTIILADRATKSLIALPLIYQKEKVPAPSAAPDEVFFAQQSIHDIITEYGQEVTDTSILRLKQTVPADSPIWEAAAKVGAARVVVVYQMGATEEPLDHRTPTRSTDLPEGDLVWHVTTVVTPDTTGMSVG